MSRSMSGINSVGDVKLDGNPNTFTGTNTFDTNLPTSTITSASTNDFITKAIGDNLYTSSVGDALLAGGTSELNPQIFTGFNFFNEVAKFEDEIYVQDKIVMDGQGSGATPTALILQKDNNKNMIKQDDAGSGGNCIYQVSAQDRPLVVPTVTGACVFQQTGVDDIIITDGKVQMKREPTVDIDCVNKLYFDNNAARLDVTNTFTGTNQFNTLPTSTFSTTTTSQNQLITKAIGDNLYGSGDVTLAGNPNTFTGTNTFNTNLPSSTITSASTNDFITKRIGDALYGGDSFRGFQNELFTTSGSQASPWKFPITIIDTTTGGYNSATGYFTAKAEDVGYWVFGCVATSYTSSTQQVIIRIRKRTNSTASNITIADSTDNPGLARGGGFAPGLTSISCIVELAVGNQISMRTAATVLYFATGNDTRFFGYKIG